MTDNEIIKALECCISGDLIECYNCPAYSVCDTDDFLVEKAVLDLINRQKAEIEGLISGQETLQKYIAEKDKKIARLEMESEALNDAIYPLPFETNFDKAIKIAKSEAVKEFAEQVIKQSYLFYNGRQYVAADNIRKLAKKKW